MLVSPVLENDLRVTKRLICGCFMAWMFYLLNLQYFAGTWSLPPYRPPPVEKNLEPFLPGGCHGGRLAASQIASYQVGDLKRGGERIKLAGRSVGEMGIELAGLLVAAAGDNVEGLTHGGLTLPSVEGVILCGGRIVGGLEDIGPVTVRHAPDGGFFSVSATKWPCGSQHDVLVLDMGKSYLKTGFCGIYRRFARNFDKFPARKAALRERNRWRRELAAFVGRKLAAVVREAGRQPQMLIVGFPCKVSPEGTPMEEAYPGMEGWGDAGHQFSAAAGLETCQVFVCNDAELAAWSALHSPVSEGLGSFRRGDRRHGARTRLGIPRRLAGGRHSHNLRISWPLIFCQHSFWTIASEFRSIPAP